MRTCAIQEELLLVDPQGGQPMPLASELLELDRRHAPRGLGFALSAELQSEQIESSTEAFERLADLDSAVREGRFHADFLARSLGARVAALGTSPVPATPHIMPSPRYSLIAGQLAQTAFEQLTCGCHLHVSVGSEDEGVGVLDRIRAWLPVLLALSANSPFWNGHDTGYASYRHQVWGRMPGTGPTDVFGSVEHYRRHLSSFVGTGIPVDPAMIYFDARLGWDNSTVVIQVADVCMDSEGPVLLAALARALVETAAAQWSAGEPAPQVASSLIALASWRASRSGIHGELIDPLTCRPMRAVDVVMSFFDHVRPALADSGDEQWVATVLDRLLREGGGARHQQAGFSVTGMPSEVVAEAIFRTHHVEAVRPPVRVSS